MGRFRHPVACRRSIPIGMQECGGKGIVSTLGSELSDWMPGCWRIDPKDAELTVSVRHLGMATVHGRLTVRDGKVITGTDPLDSKVDVTIDLTSIDTGSRRRDEGIRSAKLLNVESNASAHYRTISICSNMSATEERFTVTGELTMMGVTRPLSLECHVDGFDLDSDGTPRAFFRATGQFARSEFRLAYKIRPRFLDRAIGPTIAFRAKITALPFY
jgi:polyisoprenoid-binding protein YceI